MNLGAAAVSSSNAPSTNIPLNCHLCADSPSPDAQKFKTLWKYGFMVHMADRHLNEKNELPWIPLEMWATTHISKGEEFKLGIPQERTQLWRERNKIPDTDEVDVVLAEMADAGDSDNDDDSEDQTIRARKRAVSIALSQKSRDESPKKRQQIGS